LAFDIARRREPAPASLTFDTWKLVAMELAGTNEPVRKKTRHRNNLDTMPGDCSSGGFCIGIGF
jgi:hypothetical protein